MKIKMNKSLQSVFLLLAASLLYSLTGAASRIAGDNVSPIKMLLITSLTAGLVFLTYLFITKSWKKIERKDLKTYLFRGALILFDIPLLFVAFNNLEYGYVILIFYATVIVTNVLYGKFFLGETLKRLDYISLAVALLGLIVINFTQLGGISFYTIFAVIPGVSFALNASTSKLLSDRYSAAQVIAMTFLVGFVLAIPLLGISILAGYDDYSFNLGANGYIGTVGFGLLVAFAFFLVVNGFKNIKVGIGSIILLTEIIFSFIWGLLLYGEAISIQEFVGGMMILVALALQVKKDEG